MLKKEKKQQRMNMILVIFIAFIMVSSIFGIIFSGYNQSSLKVKYGEYKFTRSNNGVSTKINNQFINFDYFPTEVEQIELSPEIKSLLTNKPEIDTTSLTNDTYLEEIALANYNFASALYKVNIYLRSGFTTNNTFEMPIITCKDATEAVPIIFFKKSNQTKLTLKEDCIIAEARNNFDILRIKDRLLYSILSIIR